MEGAMMAAIENPRNPRIGPIQPTWKLYHNPHFSSSSSSSSPRRDSPHPPLSYNSPLLRPMDSVDHHLQPELDLERRMRRRAESISRALALDLAEERRSKAQLEEEAKRMREEVRKAREALEEERRMMRMAEVWREERVRMKMAEARMAMEEKLRRDSAEGDSGVLATRRPENPHIRRGIKGFVEFPKMVRVRACRKGGEGGGGAGGGAHHVGFNLECQKAQLVILMRHGGKSSQIGLGLAGNND